MRHARALVIFFAVLACGCAARFVRLNAETKTPVEIRRVKLRWSNVYLLRGAKGQDALVDSGSPGDVESITRALEDAGRKPTDVHLVVLTHAHGDHAGLAKFFQKNGAKIVVGRGDEVLAKQGHGGPVTRDAVLRWREWWRDDSRKCGGSA